MKTEADAVLRDLPFCSLKQTRQKHHVLVYVNQIGNFRVALKFFQSRLIPFCTINGSAPDNFRVFEKYF